MTDYPYDFGDGYKVQTVFANKTEEGVCGDVYDFRSEVEHEHPGAEIMTGYCVITETLGLVPEGCNDWNDTISAAIQDYEEHILTPRIERNKDVELNYTEINEEGEAIRETLFSVKSGWLQDYFGVDNHCQLEALLTNSDDWDPTEILINARNEEDVSGLAIGEITEFDEDPSYGDTAHSSSHEQKETAKILDRTRMMALLKKAVEHIEAFEEDESASVLKDLGFTKDDLAAIQFKLELDENDTENKHMVLGKLFHHGEAIWELSSAGNEYIFSDYTENLSAPSGYVSQNVPFQNYSHYFYYDDTSNRFLGYAYYSPTESYVEEFDSLDECLDWLVPERQLDKLPQEASTAPRVTVSTMNPDESVAVLDAALRKENEREGCYYPKPSLSEIIRSVSTRESGSQPAVSPDRKRENIMLP